MENNFENDLEIVVRLFTISTVRKVQLRNKDVLFAVKCRIKIWSKIFPYSGLMNLYVKCKKIPTGELSDDLALNEFWKETIHLSSEQCDKIFKKCWNEFKKEHREC